MSRILRHVAVAASAACACASPGAGRERAPNAIAFVHASVVPMDRERILADPTVVVVDGRIAALGPS